MTAAALVMAVIGARWGGLRAGACLRAQRINKTMKTREKAKKLWHRPNSCFVNGIMVVVYMTIQITDLPRFSSLIPFEEEPENKQAKLVTQTF